MSKRPVLKWHRSRFGSGVCVMDMQGLAFLAALAVGIVSSGVIGSVWSLATGEEARLGQLFDRQPGVLTPFRVFAALFSAPTTILLDGFWWLIAQPVFGVPILVAGLVWSFLQGVFILTQLFGFT
jgi:hypothetical protein